jgi:hypothetical protein
MSGKAQVTECCSDYHIKQERLPMLTATAMVTDDCDGE